MQWCLAAFPTPVDGRTVVEEESYHLGVILVSCDVQRLIAILVEPPIHAIGIGCEKPSDLLAVTPGYRFVDLRHLNPPQP
jgi:hypothetical protein